MIPVTKPFLPPKVEYERFIQGVWEREYLTNNGPLVQELERQLQEYLGIPHILFLTNGTIALQIALKALGLTGEIITTPFSYVATTSSIVWEGCTPVFVDIDPETFNIDAGLIEAAVTEKTTGILATHVFGNPCDIDAIQGIADKYGLKVIYDAAHCFGTTYKGRSVFHYGDISTTSFHATKLFHTIEGGAVFTNDPALHERMGYMRNFGHAGFDKFNGVGINGKNSEFHAAMGLVNMTYIEEILQRRKEQVLAYYKGWEGGNIQLLKIQEGAKWNYAYCPVLFESENVLLEVKEILEKNQIFPRRYFYPSLETLDYVEKQSVPHSNRIASKILCLPVYHDLLFNEQSRVKELLNRFN